MRLSRGLFFFVDEIFVRKFLREGGSIPLAPAPAKVPEPAEGPGLPRNPTAGLRRRPATPGYLYQIFLPFSNFKFLYSSELNEAKALGVNVKLLGEKPLHTRLVHFYLIDIKYQKIKCHIMTFKRSIFIRVDYVSSLVSLSGTCENKIFSILWA